MKPEILDLSLEDDLLRFEQLYSQGHVKFTNDSYKSQLKELFVVTHPEIALKSEFNDEVSTYINSLGDLRNRGKWVYYPWLLTLVHVLAEMEFIRVRTSRNRNLISENEQEKYYACRVGIAGLSVGNSIAISIILQGGGKRIKIADNDTLDLSNLNRIRSGVESLGLSKVEITARQIYLLNPYADIEIYRNGLTEESISDFFDDLDIIVDEVDNLYIKSRIREEARLRKIPVLMAADNGDACVIDIERYDTESETLPFLGRFNVPKADLKMLDKKTTGGLIADYIGLENHDERMLDSLSSLIGSELTSWPQLGSTALINGSIMAYVIREIVCRRKPLSGRTIISIDQQFNSQETKTSAITIKSKTPLKRRINLSSDVLNELLKAGMLAPSADNTQPWRVVTSGSNSFDLYHIPSRDMTPYDSGQRTSLISHGAFLENVRVMAKSLSLDIHYELELPVAKNSWKIAHVTIAPSGSKALRIDLDLAKQIPIRHTNRRPYKPEALSVADKSALDDCTDQIGWGKIRIVDYPNTLIAEAAAQSGQIAFQNTSAHREFFKHIRWTKGEVESTRDGFSIDTFELPSQAKLIFKLASSAKRLDFLNRTIGLSRTISNELKKLYENSAAFIAVTSERRDFRDYIMTGRLMELIWLKGTLLGLHFQPIGSATFFREALDFGTTEVLGTDDIGIINKSYDTLRDQFSLTQEEEILFLLRVGAADPISSRTIRLLPSQVIE